MLVAYCITRSDTLGGAHIHVADMAKWIQSAGHEAVVIVGGNGPYCDYLESKGVRYISVPSLRREISPVSDLLALFELRRILRGLQPDLISLHSAKAGLLGRLASVGGRKPVVFTAHGWSFTEGIPSSKAAVYRLLEKLSAPLADKIIAVSEYDRRLALEAGVGHEDQIVAIHNGMPDVVARADPGGQRGPVRLVMVARFDSQKDHATLFSALHKIKHKSWSLDLVGDGPDEQTSRSELRRLGLSDRVRFLGRRTDVAEILSQADIFVLTTHWEGFPRSILEAMRGGLPVIATDVNGIPESVEEDVTGYLIPHRDEELLASRLEYLIDHPEERVRLGESGRRSYEKHFTFARMANETFAVYEKLLEEDACASV